MSTVALDRPFEPRAFADAALRSAVALWFVVAGTFRRHGRLTMTTALVVLTIAMGIGLFRVITRMWLPRV